MRARGTSGRRPPGSSDRALWRRSQGVEATPEETERFLDLAGFVDGRLDEDDRARVSALIAGDPAAAADAAAAVALLALPMPSISERSIERAVALVGIVAPRGEVVSFPPRQKVHRAWSGTARWSSLAAAIVIAGWLGFDLGSDLPGITSVSRPYDDSSANELIDPAPLLLRDFSDGSPI